MHVAVRSRLNVGIALAGAGAIALAPIAQPMPAIAELQARAVSSAQVALTAAANPIEQWAQIIEDTLANGGALAQSYLNNPFPIVHQLLNNGLGYGQQTVTALQSSFTNLVDQLRFDNPFGFPVTVRQGLDQILAGQIYDGVNTLVNAGLGLIISPVFPLLDLLQIPVTMAQNFANVVATLPTAVLGLGLSAIGTLNGTIQATAFQAQAVFDALRTGDLAGMVGAIVATPGAIVNAVLNGFALSGAPGLLSPFGIVDQLIQTVNTIAQAIAPTTTPIALSAKVADTGPAALPSATLSVATATFGAEKVATATEATKAEETTAAGSAATEPAATTTTPAAAEPATAPETPSTATETKPETKNETGTETKPESGTTSGSNTTPNGGTDTTGGNKAEPGKTGESTKPSGSTSGEAGAGSTTGSESTGSAGTGSGGTGASGTGASGSGASGGDGGASGGSSGASGAAA